MTLKIQPSFAKGEIAPALYGRVDTAMYQVALRTARNAIVHVWGGVSGRPGTHYLAPVKDHSYAPRLIPFQFKTTDKYQLEFGDFYMRVVRDDGHVLDSSAQVNVDGVADSFTNPGRLEVSTSPDILSTGLEVFFTGTLCPELNGRRFILGSATGPGIYELQDQVTGAFVSSADFTVPAGAGGTMTPIFELATPFAKEDLYELNFTQSADIITIVHKDYGIYDLSRLDHDDWTLEERIFGPEIDWPESISITPNTTGSTTHRYRVTAISRESGEESLPGLQTALLKNITNVTQANPAVVTVSSSPGAIHDGHEFYIEGVVGMEELNGRRFIINALTGGAFTQFELVGVDSTGYGAYASGGTTTPTYAVLANSNATPNNTISWAAVAGAERYAIYKLEAGTYGLIGETEGTSFTDNNISADTGESHPRARDPFVDATDKPGAVSFYEQRQVFGGTTDDPDTSFFSQVGNFNNMNVARPVRADDAITATLNSRQVNEIRHYVPGNDLLVFTSGSEWKVNSGPDAAFAQDTIKQRQQSEWGSSWRRPIRVGNIVLFVTEDNAHVRSIGYSLEFDAYEGDDMTLLSHHLLEGAQIVEWGHIRSPESRIYMTLDTGGALTFSFEPSQEVTAWTHWDTSGKFETVSTERGGGVYSEDSVYFVVRRRVNGNTVRYIEVSRQTYFNDVRDCFFVDSGLSLDNPVAITGLSLADPVVVTAPGHGLSDGDEIDISDIEWEPNVDKYFNETQPDQLNYRRFIVQNATASTIELLDEDGNTVDGTAFNAYVEGGYLREAFDTISGLWHLEGRNVSILSDGNVITSLTITDGQVVLPRKASRVHIGLPFIVDIELLNVAAPEAAGALQGVLTKIPEVTVRFLKSRGLLIGPSSPDQNGAQTMLTEMKQREFEKLGEPTRLLTGDKKITLEPDWSTNGRIFMRQKDPLPLTILAVIPDIYSEHDGRNEED